MEPTVSPSTEDAQQASGRIRAFFALVPDEPVRLQFISLAKDVARRSRGRAISGEHVHLTLAFLGDVPSQSLPALRAVGAAMPHAGATLQFDTLGAWRASGVAWVAPSVLPPVLSVLHERLYESLTSEGFVLENRPFRPHVTLARRCVQPQPRQQHHAAIRWTVRRLCLIGSELQPDGPVHSTLAEWPLEI